MNDPERDTERRIRAVGAGPDHAGDEESRLRARPAAQTAPAGGPLPGRQPRNEPDHQDLEVPEHGGETRPDRVDGVVPRQEVAREEHTRDHGEPQGAGRQRAVAPVLHQPTRARIGSPYRQRKTVAVAGVTSAKR